MKRFPLYLIPCLDWETKRFMMNEINRKSLKVKKISTVCFMAYYILTGIMGWATVIGTGYIGGDSLSSLFIKLFTASILMTVSTLMGSYMHFKYLLGAILIQTICIAVIPPFCIVNIILIILYFRIIRLMPTYHALELQEGFPHFLEYKQE